MPQSMESGPRIESGLYSMGVALAELGGFEVPVSG